MGNPNSTEKLSVYLISLMKWENIKIWDQIYLKKKFNKFTQCSNFINHKMEKLKLKRY